MPLDCPERQQLAQLRSMSNPGGSGKGTYLFGVGLMRSVTGVVLVDLISLAIASMFFWGQGVFSGW